MADFTVVRADDVTDQYAGTDVPGEFRSLGGELGAEQLSITLIRVPPHSDFEQGTGHYHDETEELYVVTRGTLTMRFEDEVRAGRGRLGRARGAARRGARTATRATSPSSCGRSRAATAWATRTRSTSSGRRRRTPRRRADGQPRSSRNAFASRLGARASHASASSSSSSSTAISLEPDEDRRIAVEVRRREVDVRVVGEQRLLGHEVLHARAEDRPLGRGVAERLEVGSRSGRSHANALPLTFHARLP